MVAACSACSSIDRGRVEAASIARQLWSLSAENRNMDTGDFRYDGVMRWRCVALLVWGLVACTKPNPAKYCADGTCSDPRYPFCDVSGAIAGEPGSCIASACTADEFVECRGDVEVRCNPEGTNYNLVTCERGCDAQAGGCRLCNAGETACTNGQVATCDETGRIVAGETCPLGCFEDQPRCREIDPSNGLGAYLDMVSSAPDLDLENAQFNPQTGEVRNNFALISVPSFLVSAPSGGVEVRVFVANSVRITQAIALTGSDSVPGPAFALLAKSDISVTGRLWATFSAGSASMLAGCSGGNGAINNGCSYSSSAGGGGGFGTNGAKGGDVTNNSNPGGPAGIANGNERLVPLRGGCQGGRVNDGGTPLLMRGGGGGGAIQLVSRTRINIDGQVNVEGEQGGTEDYDNPLGNLVLTGGGSGGAILLEAPSVNLGASAHLAARGGDGIDVCGSTAFTCSVRGLGARPGVGATPGADISCVANGKPTKSGGGGGGLGRVRINTADGTYTKASTAVEEAVVSTGMIATR